MRPQARISRASATTAAPGLELPVTVFAIAFAPDGTKIVTGSSNPGAAVVADTILTRQANRDRPGQRCAALWNAMTGEPIMTFPHQGAVYAVAFGPDGK